MLYFFHFFYSHLTVLSLSVTLKLSPLSLPPLARPIISLETQALKLKLSDPRCPKPPISLNSHRSSTHQPSQPPIASAHTAHLSQTNAVPTAHLSQIASEPHCPSRSTLGQLSLSFCSEFFHLGVRCFGLIFLGLCHHAMLWCYFMVKNGVLSLWMFGKN